MASTITLSSKNQVVVRAAQIRARQGLRTSDAIMIATAIESDATLAVTNDRDWKKLDEIEILLLQDLNRQ